MFKTVREWFRYNKKMNQLVGDVYAQGYKVSPERYEQLKLVARKQASGVELCSTN